MLATLSLIRREISAYFLSPIAYVVLAVFLLVTGHLFYLTLGLLTESGPRGVEFPMQFLLGDARVMASDGNCTGKPSFQGFALTLNAANEADAKQRFDALAEGGQVQMPLNETFFARSFGMVADRFGVNWMVMAGPKNP